MEAVRGPPLLLLLEFSGGQLVSAICSPAVTDCAGDGRLAALRSIEWNFPILPTEANLAAH